VSIYNDNAIVTASFCTFINCKSTANGISNIRKEYYNINETLGNVLCNEKDNEGKIENISNNDNNNFNIFNVYNDFSKRKELELLKQKITL